MKINLTIFIYLLYYIYNILYFIIPSIQLQEIHYKSSIWSFIGMECNQLTCIYIFTGYFIIVYILLCSLDIITFQQCCSLCFYYYTYILFPLPYIYIYIQLKLQIYSVNNARRENIYKLRFLYSTVFSPG